MNKSLKLPIFGRRRKRLASINAEIDGRISMLMALPPDDLRLLPRATRTSIVICGEPVRLEVNREVEPDESTVVTVKAFQPGKLFLTKTCAMSGFQISPEGTKLKIPETLLWDYW